MKKVFFVLVCMLIAASVFALEADLLESFERDTPEGKYDVSLYYVGKNLGRQTADEVMKSNRDSYSLRTDIKLSNVKWDLIRQALDRYTHSRGDTYGVTINPSDPPYFSIRIIVEFTSATQYTYWVWLVHGAYDEPIMPPFFPPLYGDPPNMEDWD